MPLPSPPVAQIPVQDFSEKRDFIPEGIHQLGPELRGQRRPTFPYGVEADDPLLQAYQMLSCRGLLETAVRLQQDWRRLAVEVSEPAQPGPLVFIDPRKLGAVVVIDPPRFMPNGSNCGSRFAREGRPHHGTPPPVRHEAPVPVPAVFLSPYSGLESPSL